MMLMMVDILIVVLFPFFPIIKCLVITYRMPGVYYFPFPYTSHLDLDINLYLYLY